MKLLSVKKVVGSLPFMSVGQARRMYELIETYQIREILELGFYHGVSTCYLAGALDECGGGHITTIDRVNAKKLRPNLESLLSQLNLKTRVTRYFEPRSYHWRLMKMLAEPTRPYFDLCYLDGGHDWSNSGFAFFLADKMLKPGGWFVMDDLNWTMHKCGNNLKRPQEERITPQLRNVWDLLIREHPCYGNFMEDGDWAYAQKLRWSSADSERAT
jgi:predicted O-methyltransferase YrrM